MDVALYCSILKWRGENPYTLVDSDINRKITIVEKVFRQDIFHDKCVWVNKMRQDFLYFIQSRHPLISCFQCPAKHPYSKQKRRSTLIIMFCLGSFFASSASLFSLFSSAFIEFSVLRVLWSLSNGMILWFCDVTLATVQSCVCAERQRSAWKAVLCKVLSAMTAWLYLAISLLMFSFSLYMVIELEVFYVFVMVFILQFVYSWIFQLIGLYLRFRKLWIRDHKMVKENKKSIYYLTYKDYEEYRFSKQLKHTLRCSSRRNKSIKNQQNGLLLQEMGNDVTIHIES